jgi:hypothetical protein
MGLVRAWRRQIYGASLIAILIPAAIIAALFVATGGGPLHGLGTLGQVFSGPAIPGGNLSARVSESSKPALPGNGGAGAAALRGHSPVLGQALAGGSPGVRAAGPHASALAPLKLGTTTPSAPSNGGQLHGGSGAGGGGAGGGPSPRPPVSPPPTTPTTTTAPTTTTDTTTAASLPPIVAIPPSPVTTTTATTTTAPPVHTTTTTTTRTTTTSTTKSTTTPTTKTTTTSTTKTTTTPTTKTTTTPTTKTTTTTVTHTTTTIKAPTTKTGTHPIESVVPTVATTVAQAEHGSAVFTGCTGDWGVSATGHPQRVARAVASRRR